jgi:Zn-dependent protease
MGAFALLADGPARAPAWLAVLALSMLWHELGHALAVRRFGYPAEIELQAFGGLTRWRPPRPPRAPERLAVALAGPLAGGLLGAAALAAHALLPPGAPAEVAWMGVLVNLVWGGLNLLPVLPLDGAQALGALVEWGAPGTGQRWAARVSVAVAGTGLVGAIVTGRAPLLAVAGWVLWLSLRAAREESLSRADDTLLGDLATAQAAYDAGDAVAAAHAAGRLHAAAQTDAVRARAAVLAAESALALGDAASAAAHLDALPPGWSAAPGLRAAVQLAAGATAEAWRTYQAVLLDPAAPVDAELLVRLVAATEGLPAVAAYASRLGPRLGPDGPAELAAALAAAGGPPV